MARWLLLLTCSSFFWYPLFAQTTLKDSLLLADYDSYPDSQVYETIDHLVEECLNLERGDQALTLLQDAVDYAQKAEHRSLWGKLVHKQAQVLVEIDEWDQALPLVRKAQRIFEEYRDSLWLGKSYNTLGYIFWKKNNMLLAMKAYETAIDCYDAIGKDDEKGVSLSNIGILFAEQEEYEKTLEYFFEYLLLAEKNQDDAEIARMYTNIGVIYKRLGEYETAEKYLNRAGIIARELGHSSTVINNYLNLAAVYSEANRLEEAKQKLDEALALTNGNNSRTELMSIYINYGSIALKRNNHSKAISYFEENLRISQELGSLKNLSDAYWHLFNAYQESGKPSKALEYYILMNQYEDSLEQQIQSAELAKFSVRFENNRQQLQLEKKQTALLQKEKQVNNLYLIILLLSIIALIALSWALGIRNRSASKKNQQLKQKNQLIQQQNKALSTYNYEMERFAFILSHNLKEPLRGINSFASLLERRYLKNLDEQGREYLNFIQQGAKKMTSLLGDIRAFVDTQQRPVELEWIETQVLVEEILTEHEEVISTKKIQVQLEGMPAVYTNKAHLKQVIDNLLKNAIKYVPPGTGKILIRSEKQGEESVFAIQDNGIGIDASYEAEVFGLFSTLENYGPGQGNGLGLALCKKIIEGQYGGRIWFESKAGEGTTFYFSLPQRPVLLKVSNPSVQV